ncbi:helix-turn-helix transcriptional regulator [Microbacterium paludicola]|uniref:helix-turn-helix domain-containing protein n=1 Tax=Microbacterium paludicola TaxID=300019 RepID=UPI0011A8A369|nr:helix-turn-helix transcriptional regulator [Microbacterium paludicola]
MTLLTDAPHAPATATREDARPAPHHRPGAAVWERMIAPAVDAVREATPRAVIVGNAGSGKTVTLHHLRDLLDDRSRDTLLVGPRSPDIGGNPPSRSLIVDDLHLADDAQLTRLLERAADPDAGLIVALRPSAWNERLVEVTRLLERGGPTIVLGHVSAVDAADFARTLGVAMPDSCLRDILEFTGGVAWLVADVIRLHDDLGCGGDGRHRGVRELIEERIAHRLSMLAPPLRAHVEQACLGTLGSGGTAETSDLGIQAYAEGLLLRSGQPVPLVRTAVQADTPTERLVDLGRATGTDPADALVRHADTLLASHPTRAAELYESAAQLGVPIASLAGRRAAAAWSVGDLDAASALIDEVGAPGTRPPASDGDAADRDRLVDTAAAIWSARGMMHQAVAVYRSAPPADPISAVRARMAGFAVGSIETDAATETVAPSTLGVAMSMMRRGLDASLAPDQAEAALADLVRASEMFTASHSPDGIPELPAVIAANVALNLGGLATARSIIDDAIAGEQGGRWARSRLLLWRAWIAVQMARPAEAKSALADAVPIRCPRDELLAHAVHVAIARRYEDAAGLESAWRQARAVLLRVDVDLFLLHPLAELVSSASRVGDTDRIRPQFRRALDIIARIDEPALWSAHLHWAGIQNGILLDRPESLRPHAKALVAASSNSRVAATMAKAGRVWTAVLGGTVDADAVEKGAHGLASIGLVWDAARLAGHGAARSQDRKVSSRLLACARELHPLDGSRRAMAAGATGASASAEAAPNQILSERELEVARLVVEGKTYAEIGEAIFISPRTAEHHIAHIRRRLGANSRSEVIAKLRQLLGPEASSPSANGPHPGDRAGPP